MAFHKQWTKRSYREKLSCRRPCNRFDSQALTDIISRIRGQMPTINWIKAEAIVQAILPHYQNTSVRGPFQAIHVVGVSWKMFQKLPGRAIEYAYVILEISSLSQCHIVSSAAEGNVFRTRFRVFHVWYTFVRKWP